MITELKQKIQDVERWNEYQKTHKLDVLPLPGSEQSRLGKLAAAAVKLLDPLVDDETINYKYDGQYEHYSEKEV